MVIPVQSISCHTGKVISGTVRGSGLQNDTRRRTSNIIQNVGSEVRPIALSQQKRFHVLDGLRGVAAMAVVLLHSFLDKGGVPNGQLAVDLFFILSGFVIAHSYDEKIANGMPVREFLKRRFIRLYPMLLLGAAGGTLIAIIHNHTNPDHAYSIRAIMVTGSLSLLVLPYLGDAILQNQSISQKQPAFPFNPPIWSLFFEIFANVFYAVFHRLLTVRALTLLVAGGVIAVGVHGPLDGGAKEAFAWGLARVSAGFFGGVLLYRLHLQRRLPAISGNLVSLAICILAIFMSPVPIDGWLYAPVYGILWLIVLAAANAPKSRWDRLSAFIGDASYPVYLIHWLTLYVATFLGRKLGLSGSTYWIVVVAHLAIIPFIGLILYKYYEKPAMAFLRRRIGQ
jgi:peptidoglycan/LPS O-acetylase OafA/YrhL